MLQTQKEVRIERLAATLQLPILQSSRRRHIQRFLQIKALSILVLWFPIVKEVIARQLKVGSQLVIALDTTQWKEYNVLTHIPQIFRQFNSFKFEGIKP